MEKLLSLKKSADNKLAAIAVFREELERVEAAVEWQIAGIREQYAASAAGLTDAIAGTEKELIALMKKNKAHLFDGADQVTLENGILLYGRELRVTIPKDAVAWIEAEGWEDGLKRSVKIDREAIGKWPAERLAVIGATRKEKETYTYELVKSETAERS